MYTIGKKIKNLRIENNLKQKEMAELFCVSEKTISSWENDRTTPDLNMIYQIANHFQKSFYSLITDNCYITDINEVEIKLKVSKDEFLKILNLIKNQSIYKYSSHQIDTYYSLINKKFTDQWLRVRNENGKYIFNYKKKGSHSKYEKYDVFVDNIHNLNIILKALGVRSIGVINKNRMVYVYREKYEFSFDTLDNKEMFIEIELMNKSYNYENDINDLLKLMKELNIDFNLIDTKKYVDYL